MTGRYLRQRHACVLPAVEAHGDIWGCDECGKVWRASKPGNPAFTGWYRLGPLPRLIHRVRPGGTRRWQS